MEEYVVYRYWSPSNKSYVGQTKKKMSYRANHGEGYKSCKAFYNAIQKYGWEWFENHYEILESNLTKEEADIFEKKYIAEFKTKDSNFGYNIQDGGEFNPSELLKKSIVAVNLKTKEVLNFDSGVQAEEKLGINRKNISACVRHRNNQKQTKGYAFLSQEEWNGLTNEEREAIKNIKPYQHSSRKKQVYCIELDKTFESVKEAAAFFDSDSPRVCKCCRDGVLMKKQYHLEYKEG